MKIKKKITVYSAICLEHCTITTTVHYSNTDFYSIEGINVHSKVPFTSVHIQGVLLPSLLLCLL